MTRFAIETTYHFPVWRLSAQAALAEANAITTTAMRKE